MRIMSRPEIYKPSISLAALPVLFVMHNGARIRPPRGHRVRAQFKIINRNYL